MVMGAQKTYRGNIKWESKIVFKRNSDDSRAIGVMISEETHNMKMTTPDFCGLTFFSFTFRRKVLSLPLLLGLQFLH